MALRIAASPIEESIIEDQCLAYSNQKHSDYSSGPFTEVTNRVSDMKLTLFTSSGHFAAGNDPEPICIADMLPDRGRIEDL